MQAYRDYSDFFLYFAAQNRQKAATTYCHYCQITVLRRAEVNAMSKHLGGQKPYMLHDYFFSITVVFGCFCA